MKKIYLFCIMMASMLLGVECVVAQQQVVLQNGRGSKNLITSTKDIRVYQHNDQEAFVHYISEVKPQILEGKATYTLNVYPPVDCSWNSIYLSDGVNLIAEFRNYQGDYLSIEVEEGNYYVLCDGRVPAEDYNCFWLRDNISVTEDTDVHVDFSDCVNHFHLDLVDENGGRFDSEFYPDVCYRVNMIWLDQVYVVGYNNDGYWFFDDFSFLRFNDFGENSSVLFDVSIITNDQKSYYIRFPRHYGMSGCPTLTVGADELNIATERYYLPNEEQTSYYSLGALNHFPDGGMLSLSYTLARDFQVFDSEMPYKIISNTFNEEGFNPSSFFRTQLRSILLDSYDWDNYNSPMYENLIASTFSFDADGNVVRDASPFFQNAVAVPTCPNYYPATPAAVVSPSNQTAYFGERTPLAVYHPAAFNASNTPLNQTQFYGSFYYTGEHSCERTSDYDATIQVYLDEQVVYSDSVYKFNDNGNHFEPEPCQVIVDAHNMHLFANERPKINHTQVIFDLNQEDAMPPTMTFLRVLNEYGDESLYLDNLSQSTLVFGCADFDYHFKETEWGGYYDHMVYKGKPQVQVRCSINGINNGDWIPLEVTEDPSLFHENYGNVFVVDLSQLENRDLDEWVTVNFTLLDDAENMQTQNLSFLFYAGKMTQVQEQSQLTHSAYPSPFTNEARITTTQPINGTANIVVYNILGEQVYNQSVNCNNTKEFTIDGSNLKTGIYFYRINTKNGMMQGKILKD